eukprot:363192-Chlamydomonas_euryale.AAC.2
MSTPEGLESQSAVEAAARDSSGSGGHAVEPRHSKPPADESEATLATAQDAGGPHDFGVYKQLSGVWVAERGELEGGRRTAGAGV